MNISRRDQILLSGLVLILVAFAFFRFVYMPTREEIQSLSSTRQELQKEKERLETEAKKPPAVRQDLEEKFANLNKRLPTEDEMIPLLTVLDDSCKKFKVPLVSLDYKGSEQKSTNGSQTLVFTVGTKGKITQLFDFLNELETNQRLISVLDVSLNAVKAEPVSVSEEEENEPPAYYIAPPGIPQAKLQRVTFELEETEEKEVSDSEVPVAASLVPDTFELKITINAYYAGQNAGAVPSAENNAKDSKAGNNDKEKLNSKDAKGGV